MTERPINISKAKLEPGGKCYYGFPSSYLEELGLTDGLWPQLSGRGAEVVMEEVPFQLDEVWERPHVASCDTADKVLALLGDPVDVQVLSGTGVEAYIYSKDVAVVFRNKEVTNLSLRDKSEDTESKAWTFAFVRGKEK